MVNKHYPAEFKADAVALYRAGTGEHRIHPIEVGPDLVNKPRSTASEMVAVDRL
jgi:hypothetical protein